MHNLPFYGFISKHQNDLNVRKEFHTPKYKIFVYKKRLQDV